MQCWDKTRVPARFRLWPQFTCRSCFVWPNIGWRITTSAKLAGQKKPSLGEHGYDNADPQMQATFVAHGPAFEEGAMVPAFPNVDVYPLMTHLLGIPAMTANDGNYGAVKGMLKESAQ